MPEDKDGKEGPKLPGSRLTDSLQEAGEEALEQQAELFDQFIRGRMSATDDDGVASELNEGGLAGLSDRLAGFGSEVGAFKARVQTGGRISIPDTERDALGIGEEDIVQVFVVPVENNQNEQD